MWKDEINIKFKFSFKLEIFSLTIEGDFMVILLQTLALEKT